MANAIVRSVVTLYKELTVPGCLTDVGAEGHALLRRRVEAERHRASGVADGSIPAKSLLEHPQQHRHVAIDVVVEDPDLLLPGVRPMKPAGVLDERSPPRHGKREEERIQPRIVETSR